VVTVRDHHLAARIFEARIVTPRSRFLLQQRISNHHDTTSPKATKRRPRDEQIWSASPPIPEVQIQVDIEAKGHFRAI
jgi:hypothetical protein